MNGSAVARRLLIHVGGYDPVPPQAAHRRFSRELRRSARTWSMDASVGELELDPDLASWMVSASGPGWSARAEVRLLRWDDLMARDEAEPMWRRLPLGLMAFGDFLLGGALWRYGRHAWRYALFFLYPFVLIGLIAGLASLAGLGVARGTGYPAAGIVVGLAAAAAGLWFATERLSLSHLLDDWIFASRYVRREDATLASRLDRVAYGIVAAAREGDVDEVVIIGHSLGAVLAIDLVDRVLALDPGFGQGRAAAALVTVGSSVPKIGLHAGARRFRAALARVVAAERVFWVEYQALADVMNFYKLNPATLIDAPPDRPLLRIVRISRMLEPGYYRRIRGDFFRIHNQFVSGNDLRAAYDYFMVACGPASIERLALAEAGAAAILGPDGSLVGEASAVDGAAATP